MRQATVRSIPQSPHLRFQPCLKRQCDARLFPGSGASTSQPPSCQRTRSPTPQRHLCLPCGTAQHPSGGQRVKFHDHRFPPTRPVIRRFVSRISLKLEPDPFPCPSVQRHQHINPTTLIPCARGLNTSSSPPTHRATCLRQHFRPTFGSKTNTGPEEDARAKISCNVPLLDPRVAFCCPYRSSTEWHLGIVGTEGSWIR